MIARIAFVSILVAFFPFIGSNFFDSPVLHGFISFDTLLVSLLFFQKGRLIGQIPLTVSAFLLAFWGNSLISYSAGFSYLVIVWIFYWLKNFPKAKLIFWGSFTLFIMIADWSLFFESSFAMSLRDLFGLARFYWWGLLLFFAIPLAVGTCLVVFPSGYPERRRIAVNRNYRRIGTFFRRRRYLRKDSATGSLFGFSPRFFFRAAPVAWKNLPKYLFAGGYQKTF